jgi:hypothetical protein
VRHTAAYDFQPRSAVRSMLWSIPSRERIEERHERLEEHRIVQQAIDPAELLRKPQQLRRKYRLEQRRLIAYGYQHDGFNPF